MLLTALSLKYARTAKDLGKLLLSWVPLMKAAVHVPGGREDLGLILRYLAEVSDRVGRVFLLEELIPSLDDDDARETTMTLAEELRAEGREQGVLQGRRDLLLRLLRRRFGELPQSAIERVNTAAVEQIDAWAVSLLDAQTLAEALDG